MRATSFVRAFQSAIALCCFFGSSASIADIHGSGAQNIDGSGVADIHGSGIQDIHGSGIQDIHGSGIADIHGSGIQDIHGSGIADIHGSGIQDIHGSGIADIHGSGIQDIHGSGIADIHGSGIQDIHGSGIADIHGSGIQDIHGSGGLVISGPVDTINLGAGYFESLGQTVFASRSSIANLSPGTFVDVYGSVVGPGMLYADNLEISSEAYVPGADSVFVVGIPTTINFSKASAAIGSLQVDFSSASRPSTGLGSGIFVLVGIQLESNGQLHADILTSDW